MISHAHVFQMFTIEQSKIVSLNIIIQGNGLILSDSKWNIYTALQNWILTMQSDQSEFWSLGQVIITTSIIRSCLSSCGHCLGRDIRIIECEEAIQLVYVTPEVLLRRHFVSEIMPEVFLQQWKLEKSRVGMIWF